MKLQTCLAGRQEFWNGMEFLFNAWGYVGSKQKDGGCRP